MSTVLIAALSPRGRVAPLLAVAEDLVCRGHQVTVMTGAEHTGEVGGIGAHPHPLPASADFDDASFDQVRRTAGPGHNDAVLRLFLRPMPLQAAELRRALSARRYDAMIVDYAFFGVLPLLLGARTELPAVLYYSPAPLMLSDGDAAPTTGPPRPAQRATDRMLASMGTGPLPVPVPDVGVLADRLIVPTVPSFEYPRSALPDGVRFVGVVRPRRSHRFVAPSWWPALDGERPVVHVTQGTLDNGDLSHLVGPTIEALADEDVTVVVTTGGQPASALRTRVPANTFVAEYLPHDRLLPKVDVLVTNGGYGAVQHALSSGVPVVAAGSTRTKAEVAARVAWSGAGIDLATATPTAAAVRSAVRAVRTDRRYLDNARRMEAAFARRDGVAEVAALVDEVSAEGPRTQRTCTHRRPWTG
ncbi:MAG: glycosyltransferase [Actinomycetota bacterium]|nr:glycosyltransferase [Actinomycetota bacterium]